MERPKGERVQGFTPELVTAEIPGSQQALCCHSSLAPDYRERLNGGRETQWVQMSSKSTRKEKFGPDFIKNLSPGQDLHLLGLNPAENKRFDFMELKKYVVFVFCSETIQ